MGTSTTQDEEDLPDLTKVFDFARSHRAARARTEAHTNGKTPEAGKKARCQQTEASGRLPVPREGEGYLGAKIPMSWLTALANLSKGTVLLALALWFLGGRSRNKSPTVALTDKVGRQFRLSRDVI